MLIEGMWHKNMKVLKELSKFVLTIAITTALAIGNTSDSQATTQSTTSTSLTTPTLTTQQTRQNATNEGAFFASVQSVTNQINSFIGDIKGFIQNDIFGSLNNILQDALGLVNIPDLQKITNDIMGTSTSSNAAMDLSEKLENRRNGGENSYAIRSSYNSEAQRNAAIGIANGATLSTSAQQTSKQKLDATEDNTERSFELGQESQGSDVTQHIMQNVSSQLALNAQVNSRLYEEAQQARTDRALGNVISAQMAKELAGINTADRQNSIASGNMAIQQQSMMMLPGGGALVSDSSEEE